MRASTQHPWLRAELPQAAAARGGRWCGVEVSGRQGQTGTGPGMAASRAKREGAGASGRGGGRKGQWGPGPVGAKGDGAGHGGVGGKERRGLRRRARWWPEGGDGGRGRRGQTGMGPGTAASGEKREGAVPAGKVVAGRGRQEPGTAAGWGDERRGGEAYEREGRQIVVGVALRRIRGREVGGGGVGWAASVLRCGDACVEQIMPCHRSV
nr:spidroin-1-like [Aegilops tauschii subsp. strangulata]